MTCTPYGINTQRLLVRGHRIPNADGEDKTTSDAMQLNALYIAPFIGIPICLAIVIYIFVITSSRYLKRHGDLVGKRLKMIDKLIFFCYAFTNFLLSQFEVYIKS